jgi:uncharacterized protein
MVSPCPSDDAPAGPEEGRTMQGNGYVYWNELLTSDVQAAKAFYERSLGWTFEAMPMSEGTYWIIKPPGGDQPAGGMMQFTGGPTNVWFTYVRVDDLDGALVKCREAGGVVQREPFEVPEVGRIAIVTDPTGATLGWITPATPPASQ